MTQTNQIFPTIASPEQVAPLDIRDELTSVIGKIYANSPTMHLGAEQEEILAASGPLDLSEASPLPLPHRASTGERAIATGFAFVGLLGLAACDNAHASAEATPNTSVVSAPATANQSSTASPSKANTASTAPSSTEKVGNLKGSVLRYNRTSYLATNELLKGDDPASLEKFTKMSNEAQVDLVMGMLNDYSGVVMADINSNIKYIPSTTVDNWDRVRPGEVGSNTPVELQTDAFNAQEAYLVALSHVPGISKNQLKAFARTMFGQNITGKEQFTAAQKAANKEGNLITLVDWYEKIDSGKKLSFAETPFFAVYKLPTVSMGCALLPDANGKKVAAKVSSLQLYTIVGGVVPQDKKVMHLIFANYNPDGTGTVGGYGLNVSRMVSGGGTTYDLGPNSIIENVSTPFKQWDGGILTGDDGSTCGKHTNIDSV